MEKNTKKAHFLLHFPQIFVPLPAKTTVYENNKVISSPFIGRHDGHFIVRKGEVRQRRL